MADLFDKKPVSPAAVTSPAPEPRPLLQGELTLAQAKAAHTAGLHDGIECALCGRFDKIYKRKLNSGMTRILIILYKEDKKKPLGWVHVLDRIYDEIRNGDYGKLVDWGLAAKREGAKDDENPDNGYYRITAKGQMFCQGKIKVPKYLYFYHDRLWPVEDNEETTIQEALGAKFNWNELMGETI